MEILKVTCRGYTGYLSRLTLSGPCWYTVEIQGDGPVTKIVCELVRMDEMSFERVDAKERQSG